MESNNVTLSVDDYTDLINVLSCLVLIATKNAINDDQTSIRVPGPNGQGPLDIDIANLFQAYARLAAKNPDFADIMREWN